MYEVVLTLESVYKIEKCEIQMDAIEQYFAVAFMIILYKIVVTVFESPMKFFWKGTIQVEAATGHYRIMTE